MDENKDERCLELGREAERLCRNGEFLEGIKYFEAALEAKTNDVYTLSAIFSQLGNAYFYTEQYEKALKIHTDDLRLNRNLNERLGEAKASGNLGNTFKMMGKYDDAIICCERHLEIAAELDDKLNQCRALFNMASVYQTKAKSLMVAAGGGGPNFPHTCGEGTSPEIMNSLNKAEQFYRRNLELAVSMGDPVIEGRACGNLGITLYFLGKYDEAISFHKRRLAIGKEYGDLQAQRRAYINLGNAFLVKGDRTEAIRCYSRALELAKRLGDRFAEAQTSFSLGYILDLDQQFQIAIKYHLVHLDIAKELNDRVGEQKAYWRLSHIYNAVSDTSHALDYATKHLLLSRALEDKDGESAACETMGQVQEKLGLSLRDQPTTSKVPPSVSRFNYQESLDHHMQKPVMVVSPIEMNRDSDGLASGMETAVRVARGASTDRDNLDDDDFFEMISRFQSRRIDEQRSSFTLLPHHHGATASAGAAVPVAAAAANNLHIEPPHHGLSKEQLIDMVAGLQSRQLHDQRAYLPGLRSPEIVQNKPFPDEKFFDLLVRCQGARFDDQRQVLPPRQPECTHAASELGMAGAASSANITSLRHRSPTVPDEDFFSLIQQAQDSRIEEQRSDPPANAENGLKDSAANLENDDIDKPSDDSK